MLTLLTPLLPAAPGIVQRLNSGLFVPSILKVCQKTSHSP